MIEPEKYKRYIGDALYVDFDSYLVSIAVNEERNYVAFVDSFVAINLIKYLCMVYRLKIDIDMRKNDNESEEKD